MRTRAVAGLTTLVLVWLSPMVLGQEYNFLDLGTLGGSNSWAVAINNSGVVVGRSYLPGSTVWHAFRTSSSSPINPATDDLGTLGGSYSVAAGINDAGIVSGYSWLPGNKGPHAFRISPNSVIHTTDDIGAFSSEYGTGPSYVYGINASGQMAGNSNVSGRTHALRSIGPITIADDLGTPGSDSYGQAINDLGQVVGYITTPGGLNHAFRTAPNMPINTVTDDLGTLGGNMSYAYGIDNSGRVVGWAHTSTGQAHAFRTAPNSPTSPSTDDLGTLGGATSMAFAINNLGDTVGSSAIPSGINHAFLYTSGTMKDLNSMIPAGTGWTLVQAYDINDNGQIIGQATDGVNTHGFLLTPVPEPATLSLLALGGLAMMRRRRHRK